VAQRFGAAKSVSQKIAAILGLAVGVAGVGIANTPQHSSPNGVK
jgi:hypothetical protein